MIPASVLEFLFPGENRFKSNPVRIFLNNKGFFYFLVLFPSFKSLAHVISALLVGKIFFIKEKSERDISSGSSDNIKMRSWRD